MTKIDVPAFLETADGWVKIEDTIGNPELQDKVRACARLTDLEWKSVKALWRQSQPRTLNFLQEEMASWNRDGFPVPK